VFLLAFGALVAAAPAGLYLGDAGELSVDAFGLGVGRLPGVALFSLAGKLFTLVPLGQVAFRANLLSALSGALAAWLAYAIVRELGGRRPAAEASGVGAAALLIAGFTFFHDSCVAAVQAPTVAALALALRLLLAGMAGDRRASLALALVFGLSLGLHPELRLLFGPPLAAWVLWRLRRADRWPLLAPSGVALGAAVLAYLPLRAARAPLASPADPRTLSSVVSHLSGAARGASGSVGQHLKQLLGIVEGDLGILALLAAAGGLLALLARGETRGFGAVLMVIACGDLLYASDGAPLALVLAIAAGVGLDSAARRAGRAAPFVAGALAVVVCVPAALADGGGKLGFAQEAGRVSRAALAQAAPRALVIPTSDDLSGGLAYEQQVAGARPDVTALGRRPRTDVARRVRQQLRDGAVLWEPGRDPPPIAIANVTPAVPLALLGETPAPLPAVRPLVEQLETLLAPARDPVARRRAAEMLRSLGRLYDDRGHPAQAHELDKLADRFEEGLRR
jgi:hypothetical protein